MKIHSLINKPADWMHYYNDKNDVVLTTRIRLARNLDKTSFPGWLRRDEKEQVFQKLHQILKSHEFLQKGGLLVSVNDHGHVEKQLFVERHIASRELMSQDTGAGFFISKDQRFIVMMNEEDHIRMQCINSGNNITSTWKSMKQADTLLSQLMEYAYDKRLGYLTSCPSNVGKAIRVSQMMHLPGLCMMDEMRQVANAAIALKLTVRGIYGEGSNNYGHIFQISNQSSRYDTEEEILENMKKISSHLITQELQARQRYMMKNQDELENSIARAYGIIKHATMMSVKEALQHISTLRLGAYLGYFPKEANKQLGILSLQIQPAHIQYRYSIKPTDDREAFDRAKQKVRAQVLRQSINKLGYPDIQM